MADRASAFAGGETDTAKLAIPVENAANAGGSVAGVLNEARADAVFKQHAATDKAFNDAVQNGSFWAKTAFSTTVGGITGGIDSAAGVSKGSDFIVDQILQGVTASVHQRAESELLSRSSFACGAGAQTNADSLPLPRSVAGRFRDAIVKCRHGGVDVRPRRPGRGLGGTN